MISTASLTAPCTFLSSRVFSVDSFPLVIPKPTPIKTTQSKREREGNLGQVCLSLLTYNHQTIDHRSKAASLREGVDSQEDKRE